jgi:hypothetical protein
VETCLGVPRLPLRDIMDRRDDEDDEKDDNEDATMDDGRCRWEDDTVCDEWNATDVDVETSRTNMQPRAAIIVVDVDVGRNDVDGRSMEMRARTDGDDDGDGWAMENDFRVEGCGQGRPFFSKLSSQPLNLRDLEGWDRVDPKPEG